ncbi:MAG: hypothetical protein VX715_03715 [Planctomycetota bacterium]|nr:hypothetical protein [Planctomycetota bacterium]
MFSLRAGMCWPTRRAGHVDTYSEDSPNPPHHCGGEIIFAPDGEMIGCSQRDEIRDEMVVIMLEKLRLDAERALPNYTLRARRPELYQELVKEQVKS